MLPGRLDPEDEEDGAAMADGPAAPISKLLSPEVRVNDRLFGDSDNTIAGN